MKSKMWMVFAFHLFFLTGVLQSAFAMEHTQQNGLFSMNIPEQWRWFEYPKEIVITYSDGKTLAMDIQLVPSQKFSAAQIKKIIQESNDKMIEGLKVHGGSLLDKKEIKLDGVYATQLDFRTAPPNPVSVTYISCFNKGYAFSITYGTTDDTMHEMMDDAVATFKFN